MQGKDAETTENPAQRACSAKDAQGGGCRCLDWAGPWLCFLGRSHCVRVRGSHPVLPPPSVQPCRTKAVTHPKTYDGQQHLQRSATVLPPGCSCAGSGLQGRWQWHRNCVVGCCHCLPGGVSSSGCPGQVATPLLSSPRGNVTAAISWGAEKPVYT